MLVCERFHAHHATAAFASGQPTLDRWLISHAATAQAKRIAQVFVWVDEGSDAVRAYFALSAHEIRATDLPRRLSRGIPERLPAVLLGRLALSEDLHGQRLGGHLLYDVYQRVLAATENVAARFLVVDAIDEPAAEFYEHFGFTRMPDQPSLRLVRKISDIAADVNGPEFGTKG